MAKGHDFARPRLAAFLPLAALVAAGCAFPTDEGASYFVTVAPEEGKPATGAVLLRGNRMLLVARAWRRAGERDSVEVPNVEIAWSSAAPTLATVTPTGPRGAEVTGILADPVPVVIQAIAIGFQSARPGWFALRVANPLEVDSVRPFQVKYGERLTVYGVGIREIQFASLGGTPLLADTASFQGLPGGLGRMSFWVPPPAGPDHLLAIGAGVFEIAGDSTMVAPVDLYEPNDSTPRAIRLDGPAPYPASPLIRLVNPALAFEELRGDDSVGVDWYRFINPAPNTPYTFIIDPPGQGGGNHTFLASPNNPSGPPSRYLWSFGSGRYTCKGVSFSPRETPSDRIVFALKRLAPGAVDLVSEYQIAGPYTVLVVQGYLTVNPKIGPDRFEENDTCDFADENFADPRFRIDLTSPFSDTLTIDNPHDIDWFRFRVPGSGPQQTTIQVRTPLQAVPANSVAQADLGLFLFSIPIGFVDTKQQLRNSAEALTVDLQPGEYYLAVLDQGGAPTPYSLCIALGASCALMGNVTPGPQTTVHDPESPVSSAEPRDAGTIRHPKIRGAAPGRRPPVRSVR